MTNWNNADGLQVRFGGHSSGEKYRVNRPRALSTYGAFKQLEIDVDLTHVPASGTYFPADLDNNGTDDGFTQHDASLPAYASIVRAIFVSSETAVGGTNIDIGLHEADGTAIDADGIFVDLLTAEMAVGEVSYGDGALVQASGIGGASIGATAGYVSFSAVGTFTAGKGRLIIEYLDPIAP